MKISRIAIVALSALAITIPAIAQTAEDVINKAIAAEGGAAKKQLNTLAGDGKFTIPAQGIDGTFVEYRTRPNKYYLKLSMMGDDAIMATNGTVCWQVNPFAGSTDPAEMSPEEAKAWLRDSDFDGFYYDMEAKGITAELVGVETIDGKNTNHVKLLYKDGHVKHCYFCVDTGLMLAMKEKAPGQMGMEVDVSAEFDDYRDVSGVKFPFHILLNHGGMEIDIIYENLAANANVDDTVFEMAAEKK